ncbi:MAG: Bug family tripartite tricarboxylate transporter substrate binding protein [Candidatus Methylomirabilia bacterium]
MHLLFAGLAVGVLAVGGASGAQDYPAKPITFVVPWPAGGSTDIIGRMVGSFANKYLGQPVAVVNRVGGVGTIATKTVLNAPKDGYTVLVTTVGNQVLQPVARDVGFMPRDFIPIGQISARTMVLASNKGQPWSDINGLIAAAKKAPGQITFAAAARTLPWRAASAFAKAAGIQLKFVPAKGDGEAVPLALGGHVHLVSSSSVNAVISHIKAGTMKPLLVFTAERSEVLPDTPTAKEAGYGVVMVPWTGLAVAKGTPPEAVEKLRDALAKIVNDKAFKRFAARSGTSIDYLDGPAFGAVWDRDYTAYKKALGK